MGRLQTRVAAGGLLSLVLILCGYLLVRQARAPDKHEVPASTRFRSAMVLPETRFVAYSPNPDADAATMESALIALRGKFNALSLYGCTAQTITVVQIAQRLHYRAILLTVWDPRAEAELAIAASLIRDHEDALAMAVSVGSEGLMQHRYTLADMQSAREELLERNTAATHVEITTTEPWWLYLKPEQAGLRSFGDFTSINVHVVWDTDIRTPDLAASWTRDRTLQVQGAVSKPVLLREAGFPGGGNSPRNDVPTPFHREMQAGFWTAWLSLQGRPPAVVFEGVDNPAKHWRGFEGTWGLLSESLIPWPAWSEFTALNDAKAAPAPVH